MTAERIFLDFSIRKLRQYMGRIAACVELLTEEQVWQRSGPGENAVGNLLLHLAGNVRQWILTGIDGQPDVRVRDREFAEKGGIGKAELVAHLSQTVAAGTGVLERLGDEKLVQIVTVQKHYKVSILEVVYHVVEHFGQHTGQVIFASKALTGSDLNFYPHLSGKGSTTDLTP
jgi:uncharacterized damage-inducible protein DinB